MALSFISSHVLPLCTPPKWLVNFFFSFPQGWFGIHAIERIASWTCGGMIFRWHLPLEKIMRKLEPLAVEKEKEFFICSGHLVSEGM